MNMRNLIMTVSLLLGTQSFAANGMRLGVPTYGGTGCPAGTASVSLSPDEQELSVLFDSFVVEAGNTTGRKVDRKSCNLSIPVYVPQGYSVAIFTTDYRGFNAVPAGGMTKLDTEYFWAGMRGPRFSKMFTGPRTENFYQSNGVIASALVWSRCGDNVLLRINTGAMAQTNIRNEQTMLAVDSADIASSMVYHFQWKQCF